MPSSMAAISEFFSYVYTMTIIFFTLLFVQVIVLIKSITGVGVSNFSQDQFAVITKTEYLKLIEEKHPTFRYSRKSWTSFSPSSRVECAVCLSEVEEGEKVRKLKCKHTFHKDCLDRWLQQYFATCPLCRRKVLPDKVVANYRRLQNLVEYEYDLSDDQEMIFMMSSLHDNSLNGLI